MSQPSSVSNSNIVPKKDSSINKNEKENNNLASYKNKDINNNSHATKVTPEKMKIKSILKAECPCARVILNCDDSGTYFERRCLRLYKCEETHIGRYSKFGGDKPEEVL